MLEIYLMKKKIDLLLNALHPNQNKEVPDPWYGEEDGYHKVFKMIDAACNAIIEKANQPKTVLD